MEMCYDGALVMPNNFAVVNEEEMTYVDGGFYLNNTQCNKVMFYSLAALGLGSAALKLGWSAIKMKIAAGLTTLVLRLYAATVSTLVGIALATAVAGAIAVYGVSFYEGIYTAQWKGTGCDFSISWFHLKKKYR